MTIDLNRDGPDLRALLKAAEANAETDFEIRILRKPPRENQHVRRSHHADSSAGT